MDVSLLDSKHSLALCIVYCCFDLIFVTSQLKGSIIFNSGMYVCYFEMLKTMKQNKPRND